MRLRSSNFARASLVASKASSPDDRPALFDAGSREASSCRRCCSCSSASLCSCCCCKVSVEGLAASLQPVELRDLSSELRRSHFLQRAPCQYETYESGTIDLPISADVHRKPECYVGNKFITNSSMHMGLMGSRRLTRAVNTTVRRLFPAACYSKGPCRDESLAKYAVMIHLSLRDSIQRRQSVEIREDSKDKSSVALARTVVREAAAAAGDPLAACSGIVHSAAQNQQDSCRQGQASPKIRPGVFGFQVEFVTGLRILQTIPLKYDAARCTAS